MKHRNRASGICYQAEWDYLSAWEIIFHLLSCKFLTLDEFRQIDQSLKEKFSAVLGPLLAENPCYVREDAA